MLTLRSLVVVTLCSLVPVVGFADGRRPLSEAEQAALPLLARGAAMRFLLTRLVDFLNVPPGALVKPKDPLEYVRKLRFHQGVKALGDYGVTQAGCAA